jgi:hypothetical protein
LKIKRYKPLIIKDLGCFGGLESEKQSDDLELRSSGNEGTCTRKLKESGD